MTIKQFLQKLKTVIFFYVEAVLSMKYKTIQIHAKEKSTVCEAWKSLSASLALSDIVRKSRKGIWLCVQTWARAKSAFHLNRIAFKLI